MTSHTKSDSTNIKNVSELSTCLRLAAEHLQFYDKVEHLANWGFNGTFCHYCQKKNSEINGLLMQCGKCKKAYYCSTKCFNAALPDHSQYCATSGWDRDPVGSKIELNMSDEEKQEENNKKSDASLKGSKKKKSNDKKIKQKKGSGKLKIDKNKSSMDGDKPKNDGKKSKSVWKSPGTNGSLYDDTDEEKEEKAKVIVLTTNESTIGSKHKEPVPPTNEESEEESEEEIETTSVSFRIHSQTKKSKEKKGSNHSHDDGTKRKMDPSNEKYQRTALRTGDEENSDSTEEAEEEEKVIVMTKKESTLGCKELESVRPTKLEAEESEEEFEEETIVTTHVSVQTHSDKSQSLKSENQKGSDHSHDIVDKKKEDPPHVKCKLTRLGTINERNNEGETRKWPKGLRFPEHIDDEKDEIALRHVEINQKIEYGWEKPEWTQVLSLKKKAYLNSLISCNEENQEENDLANESYSKKDGIGRQFGSEGEADSYNIERKWSPHQGSLQELERYTKEEVMLRQIEQQQRKEYGWEKPDWAKLPFTDSMSDSFSIINLFNGEEYNNDNDALHDSIVSLNSLGASSDILQNVNRTEKSVYDSNQRNRMCKSLTAMSFDELRNNSFNNSFGKGDSSSGSLNLSEAKLHLRPTEMERKEYGWEKPEWVLKRAHRLSQSCTTLNLDDYVGPETEKYRIREELEMMRALKKYSWEEPEWVSRAIQLKKKLQNDDNIVIEE